jgi:hypothetical protein
LEIWDNMKFWYAILKNNQGLWWLGLYSVNSPLYDKKSWKPIPKKSTSYYYSYFYNISQHWYLTQNQCNNLSRNYFP